MSRASYVCRPAVVVYDNFNYMDYVRDQTLGNCDIMRNLTTGLPINGLT